MVTRDFDAMLAEKANVRPTFKVSGQTFTMKARLHSDKYFEMQEYLRNPETTEKQAMRRMFETVLVKSDRERFFHVFDGDLEGEDDDVMGLGIDIQQLDEMTTWILEFYSGKAGQNSQSSTPGTSTTGQQQNVVSLNPRTA